MTRLTLNVLRSLVVILGMMTAAPVAAQTPAQPATPPPVPLPTPVKEPETGPHGDWIWAAQLSFSYMFQNGAGADGVEFGAAPVITFGAVRGLTCHVEAFAAAVLPIHQPITFAGGQGDLAPSGFQAGFTFKTCQRPKGDFYGGVLFGAYTSDESESISANGTSVKYRFAGGPGAGFTAGYRYTFARRLAIDGGIRWQRLHAVRGDIDEFEWNPLQVLVSALIRF
jgi:hypothetical protein